MVLKEEIRLTMKAAIMFEKLTGRHFTGISDSPEDIDMLIYCAFVCSTGIQMTKSAFDYMIGADKKLMDDISYKFEKMSEFELQFKTNEQNEETEQTEHKVDFSLTEAMNTLIFDYGMDADYVLNKMDLWEVECLFKGAEEHFHTQMEDKRLWAYVNMLPHIDKKHSKSFTPMKLMEFPWEKKENKEKAEKLLEQEKKNMQNIIGKSIDEIIANGKRRTDDRTGSEPVSGRNEETERTDGVGEGGSGEQGTAGGRQDIH